MPSTLTEASPLVYPSSITIPNPGERRTIESIGGGASASGVGMKGVNNRVAWIRNRLNAALRAPLQGVSSEIDAGMDTAAGSSNVLLRHFHHARTWVMLTAGTFNVSRSGLSVEAGFSLGGPTDTAWNDAASSEDRVVAIGDSEAIHAPTDVSAWTACTGGIASGAWRAIIHDGTNFVAGNNAGQFSTSADGETFSSVISGGTNWLAGSNSPRQIALGKGPALAPRLIAVASAGTEREYFAISDNNGATWTEVDTGASDTFSWVGIAYRETDHLWVAIGTNVGGTSVYTSADGGATWAVQTGALPSVTPTNRLFCFNEHFVTANSTGLLYAFDVTQPWYRGARVDRSTLTPKSLTVGAGRLGWLLSATETDIFFGLSEAGDFSWELSL